MTLAFWMPAFAGMTQPPREPQRLQFPPAAATALVLLIAVVLILVMLTRLVDIRKEL